MRCKNSSKCAVHRPEQSDSYDCVVAKRQYETQAGPVYAYDAHSQYWDRMITDDIEYRRRMLCDLKEVGQTNYNSWQTRGPIQKVERIVGPISLTQIQMHDRVFYIFADEHTVYKHDHKHDPTEKPLGMEDIDFIEFLDLVLRTSPYPIDVIIETYTYDLGKDELVVHQNKDGSLRRLKYLERLHNEANDKDLFLRRITDIKDNELMLVKVSEWFKKCLVPSKRGRCRYSARHRFHNNDYRVSIDYLIAAEELLGPIPEAGKLKWLQQLKPSELRKLLDGQFKIEEQLSNCDQDVAQIIRGWLEENTKDIFHEFVKLAYKFDSDFMTCMAESDTFMALMDAYTMARSMRSFKEKSNHNDTMRNIFMYVGFEHADHYVELLKRLGGDLKTRSHAQSKIVDVRAFRPWTLMPSKDQV